MWGASVQEHRQPVHTQERSPAPGPGMFIAIIIDVAAEIETVQRRMKVANSSRLGVRVNRE